MCMRFVAPRHGPGAAFVFPDWVYASLYSLLWVCGHRSRTWQIQLVWFFHMKFQGGERTSGHFQVELNVLSQGWDS